MPSLTISKPKSRRLDHAIEEAKRHGVKLSYLPHSPWPKQQQFLSLTQQEAFYGGAAGGGKSDALLMAFIGACSDHPGYAALILRKTFRDLNQPGAIMSRAKEWLAGTDAKWNSQDKRFTFPNGSTLTFGYLEGDDDVYQYQSAEFQGIGFDELTQFKKFQYTYMFSRLRRPIGSGYPLMVRSASNPGGIGHDWVFNRFVVNFDADRPFVPATLIDNPAVDADEYVKSLSELTEASRRQLMDGDWSRPPVAGALWKPAMLEWQGFRWPSVKGEGKELKIPEGITRIVIAVDPTWTDYNDQEIEVLAEDGKTPAYAGDLCGIIVLGQTEDNHGVVLADLSGLMSPNKWAQVTVAAYRRFNANAIAIEKNGGGSMVFKAIEGRLNGQGKDMLPVIEATAILGKRARAEPVSAAYEQHRFRHAGPMPDLEAEMVSWDAKAPGSKSPNRIDALVIGAFALNICNIQGLRITDRIIDRS